MNELEEIRKEIDILDEKMAGLFEQRMLLVRRIARYKADHSIPTYDCEREAQIKSVNSIGIGDSLIRSHYSEFIENILDISKKYQKELNEK